jgi:hypothetical protein
MINMNFGKKISMVVLGMNKMMIKQGNVYFKRRTNIKVTKIKNIEIQMGKHQE